MKLAIEPIIENSVANQKDHLNAKLQPPFDQQSQYILSIYGQFSRCRSLKQQKKYIWAIFQQCYNNTSRQKSLAQCLKLPFVTGPISLNPLPPSLLKHNQNMNQIQHTPQHTPSQLQFLFSYLKNVKQYYFCWVIYFNEELHVLNVKLFKRQEIQDHQQLFNPQSNLIGIFINRTKHPLLNCHKDSPVQKRQKIEDQFYEKDRCQTNVNTKSTQSLNNSTGITFKLNCSQNQTIEKAEPFKSDFKIHKSKIRSISPKLKSTSANKESKGLSFMKRDGIAQKQAKKDQTHPTIFTRSETKQKSKSYIQLLRSKSKKFKSILLKPQKIENPFLKQLVNSNKTKTKLKKSSNIKKTDEVNNKPSFKRNPYVHK